MTFSLYKIDKLPTWVKVILTIRVILIVPWLTIAGVSGMAFDAGPSVAAYFFVGCIWTYPVMVLIAFFLSQNKPVTVFMPCLNFGLFLLGAFLEHLHVIA